MDNDNTLIFANNKVKALKQRVTRKIGRGYNIMSSKGYGGSKRGKIYVYIHTDGDPYA